MTLASVSQNCTATACSPRKPEERVTEFVSEVKKIAKPEPLAAVEKEYLQSKFEGLPINCKVAGFDRAVADTLLSSKAIGEFVVWKPVGPFEIRLDEPCAEMVSPTLRLDRFKMAVINATQDGLTLNPSAVTLLRALLMSLPYECQEAAAAFVSVRGGPKAWWAVVKE